MKFKFPTILYQQHDIIKQNSSFNWDNANRQHTSQTTHTN